MENDLTAIKNGTEKIFHTAKNGIGIVHKTKKAIFDKIVELESYHEKQKELDHLIYNEADGQLNNMYKINMQLETKKHELAFVFDTFSPNHERLEAALNVLKSKSIDESLIKQTVESDTTNTQKLDKSQRKRTTSESLSSNEDSKKSTKDSQEESKEKTILDTIKHANVDDKWETLYDFVDIETINMSKSSFQEHLKNLSSIRNVLDPMINKLLSLINQKIFDMKKSQDKLVFEYTTIKSKYTESEGLLNETLSTFDKLEKDYKRLISFVSIKKLSQIPADKEAEMIHGYNLQDETQWLTKNEEYFSNFPAIVEELEHMDDNISNVLFAAYMETYEEKQKNLLELVNFVPTVQSVIAKITNYWKYFESERNELQGIFIDIEKLTIWYENFAIAYDKFESELQERRDHEIKINEEVRAFQENLNSKYSAEFKRRVDFNQEHSKYLPENLRSLLDDPPIRYEVYPQMLNFSNIYSNKAKLDLTPKQLDKSKIDNLLKEISESNSKV